MFSGKTLLEFWETGKTNGLSQRKLASFLDIGFNSLHGSIYREQMRRKEPNNILINSKTYDPVLLKPCVFDIETTDFHAGGNREHFICLIMLPLDSNEPEIVSLEFKDNGDDRKALQKAIAALSGYDILIGHNVLAFDLPWLNTRLDYHGMDRFDKKFLIYDTYQAARRACIKADRKSLAFLSDFFRLDNKKTSIYPVAWSMIDSRNEDEFEDARDSIIEHCIGDVFNNREVFNALWPIDRSMVNMPVYKK
jgi:hypothetical protein